MRARPARPSGVPAPAGVSPRPSVRPLPSVGEDSWPPVSCQGLVHDTARVSPCSPLAQANEKSHDEKRCSDAITIVGDDLCFLTLQDVELVDEFCYMILYHLFRNWLRL